MVPDDPQHDGVGEEPALTEPVAPARAQGDVTLILSRIEQGEPQAAEQLLPLVYEELRKLAAAKMAQEKPGQTLQATALVHEAYLRLVRGEAAQHWNGRGHFLCAAAEAMRRILVEQVRRKRQPRHGAGRERVSLDGLDVPADLPSEDLLALHEALARLESEDTAAAELVKLRFFAGFTMPDVAHSLGISLRSAERNWTYARTWLHREMSQCDTPRC